jgi:excisionase family DNA binding protein
MEIERYMTPREAAQRLGIGEVTVLAAINRGDLTAQNFGRGVIRPRWRISRENLEKWIASRANTAPEQARRRALASC